MVITASTNANKNLINNQLLPTRALINTMITFILKCHSFTYLIFLHIFVDLKQVSCKLLWPRHLTGGEKDQFRPTSLTLKASLWFHVDATQWPRSRFDALMNLFWFRVWF